MTISETYPDLGGFFKGFPDQAGHWIGVADSVLSST